MTQAYTPLLGSTDINRVILGRHEDVFSVLGQHRHPAGKGLIVRAFFPEALSVEVIDLKSSQRVASLHQIHESGLFEGGMGRRRREFGYYFRVGFADGAIEINDPYRFSSQLSEHDLYLFSEGTQEKLYRWMGAHHRQVDGQTGIVFVVWAPNASRVSVVGDFNHWDGRRHVMRKHAVSGVWEIFIPDLEAGVSYQYEILDEAGNLLPLKADPYAFSMQRPPGTASKTVSENVYHWCDEAWMTERSRSARHHAQPVSIYEVHAGSWRRDGDLQNRYLSYVELAEQLIPYVLDLGFTHIQFMPVSEYPFDGSWGYQPIGMFAPSSRFGSPDEFRALVDRCHQNGIGVLLDWVPGHFPTDPHGIGRFDGTSLYEHEDRRKGFHPDWNTLIYNYGRGEVMSYLISNAMYWLDEFHIDGLRVDAVASMLYLDYSREQGQWIPNRFGGRENLEAIEFLRQVNNRVYFNFPGVIMVAEESTTWPGVSHRVSRGGLGFGFKWNMGWMNDTLRYMMRDPIFRKHHHNEITFSLTYSFTENFVLPLSHDEVVHGKSSLIRKMPGDEWQKFANLRAYLGFMWTHPGKKLLFMGSEFAQIREWNHDVGLDWPLLENEKHAGISRLIKDLNRVYREIPDLHECDCESDGFQWLDADNHDMSVFAFMRMSKVKTSPAIVIINMTPVPHHHYRLGVPFAGYYEECLNTDSEHYGGTNMGNQGGAMSIAESCHGQPQSIFVVVPPLATLILRLSDSK